MKMVVSSYYLPARSPEKDKMAVLVPQKATFGSQNGAFLPPKSQLKFHAPSAQWSNAGWLGGTGGIVGTKK
jgi:hypothetical protein